MALFSPIIKNEDSINENLSLIQSYKMNSTNLPSPQICETL